MGHDDTRGKGASNNPKPADELESAFDSIDHTMKEVARREVTVTPEALEQIVNDAVTKAITAYAQFRAATPDPSASPAAAAPTLANDSTPRQPAEPAAAPVSPWQAKLERLKDDMGLDEIEFEHPSAAPPGPVEKVGHGTLSKQMGVHDFEFDDIPGAAAKPAAHAPLDIDAVTQWMNESAATADVHQVRATAGGKAKTREGEQAFDWVAAELAALDAADTGIAADPPAAPSPDPPTPQKAPKPVAPAIERPRADFDKPEGLSPPVRFDKPSTSAPSASAFARATADKSADKEGLSPPVHRPKVRQTRSGLAGWFRSALGDRSPQREPARVPVPQPTAQRMAAGVVPRQREPEVVAPAPVAAQPQEQPRPTPGPAAPLTPTTAEEAADTIRFTFDPIPPVPPRLPREPKDS